MIEHNAAITAPQPIVTVQQERWEIDTAHIRHDVNSIKMLLIVMMLIAVACMAAGIIFEVQIAKDVKSFTGNSSQVTNSCDPQAMLCGSSLG